MRRRIERCQLHVGGSTLRRRRCAAAKRKERRHERDSRDRNQRDQPDWQITCVAVPHGWRGGYRGRINRLPRDPTEIDDHVVHRLETIRRFFLEWLFDDRAQRGW